MRAVERQALKACILDRWMVIWKASIEQDANKYCIDLGIPVGNDVPDCQLCELHRYKCPKCLITKYSGYGRCEDTPYGEVHWLIPDSVYAEVEYLVWIWLSETGDYSIIDEMEGE